LKKLKFFKKSYWLYMLNFHLAQNLFKGSFKEERFQKIDLRISEDEK